MTTGREPDGRAETPRRPTAAAAAAIEAFLVECSRRLTERADRAEARRGAEVFATALARSTPTPDAYRPGRLPVLDTLGAALAPGSSTEDGDGDDRDAVSGDGDGDGDGSGRLADRFRAVAPLLPWIPSPRSDDGGTTMALSPLDRTRDFGPVVVGLMLLGPGVAYPLHAHRPQELYLTVAGTARWRYGGHHGLETIGPLRTLYNRPDDLHTAVAGPDPVVALYVLWDDEGSAP